MLHVKKQASVVSGLLLVFAIQVSTTALAQMPALSPLPQTGTLSTPANPAQFTFVISGDNRPAKKGCKQPPTPGIIFAAVKAMNPPAAFVLWTGDTISGKAKNPTDPKDAAQVVAEYAEFLGIAKTAGVPVFNAPGNHEMDDSSNAPSDAMKALYEKNMAGTYGAFTYGNSRFIALDSEHTPQSAAGAAAKKKEDAPGSITQKELDLLKADLDADKNLAHVFIFMHHPVVPYKAKDGLDQGSVQKLQALFANYNNVSYVLAGHEHMYYNPLGKGALMLPPSRTDPAQPPFYLVSGGGGAPLKDNTTGSFYHYIVFQVNGATVTPTLWIFESCDPCAKGKETSPQ
jgi:hypothetical protein